MIGQIGKNGSSPSSFHKEIKQFLDFCNIHYYYQKRMSEQEIALKGIMVQLLQALMIQHDDQLCATVFLTLMEYANEPCHSSILKTALRTVRKLIKNDSFKQSLIKQNFDFAKQLKTMYACKFENHEHEQEEVILLLIQKIAITAFGDYFDLIKPDEDRIACYKYFFRVLKKRALSDSTTTSLHMSEGTKLNLMELVKVGMQLKDRAFKLQVVDLIETKWRKHFKRSQDSTASFTDVNISKEYAISIAKAMFECVQTIFACGEDEARWLLEQKQAQLIQFTCEAAENSSILIRNLGQQFFALFLMQILKLKLPMREEIEVLFVKAALKPLVELEQKLKPKETTLKPQEAKPVEETKKNVPAELVIFDDHEESTQPLPSSEIQLAIQPDGHSQEAIELDMSLTFLTDLLLTLSPEQIAQFYLLYDCQPFSENLIGRSLFLIIKLSQLQGANGSMNQCYNAIQQIIKGLNRFDAQSLNMDGCSRSQAILHEMSVNKSAIKELIAAANDKPKRFYAKIEESYPDEAQAKVASKVLLYSRRLQIDKIAETFGGKDDKSKKTLEAYLQRQDFTSVHVQDSLRGFMQTFRMAGIDSQVVFRILEHFAKVYYSKDANHTFVSEEEAYEFTYLIIVLQTCQHNPSIKEKTSLERFMGQALAIVPKSYDKLPDGYVKEVFDKVTQNEIKAPVTRDLFKGSYCSQIGDELRLRLLNAKGKVGLSDTELLSTSDLSQKQLYEYNNAIEGVVPVSLQQAALRHLVSLLTAKFCQLAAKVSDSKFNQFKKFEVTKTLITANQTFKNADWVDRLLIDLDKQVNALYRIQQLDNAKKTAAFKDLQELFWKNFGSLKLSVVLVPKLAPNLLDVHQGMFHYASFNAVEFKIRTKFGHKFFDKKSLLTLYQEPQKLDQTSAKQEACQGGGGLFSIVYNYFADNNQPVEDQKKKQESVQTGTHDCECLKQILDTFNMVRVINTLKNSQPKKQEEGGEEVPVETVNPLARLAEYLAKWGISLTMTVDLLIGFAKENMSARKTLLCIEFIKQMLDASLSTNEQTREEFMALRQHIFASVKTLMQMIVRPAKTTVDTLKSETDSFDGLSTKSDQQFSQADATGHNLALHFLKPPVFSQLDQSLCEQVNRHLSLDLYTSSARQAALDSPEASEVAKDVHKTLQAIVEEELSKDLFEESFLLRTINSMLKPTQNNLFIFQRYAKLPKVLRMVSILMILSNSEACNRDKVQHKLLKLLHTVIKYYKQVQPTPFDLINQSLDGILLKPSVKSVGLFLDNDHLQANKMLNQIMDICADILQIQEAHTRMHPEDSASFEVWFKVLKTLQSRVLLSPYSSLFVDVQTRACSMIKTQILNFQFMPIPFQSNSELSPLNKKSKSDHHLGTGIALTQAFVSPQTKAEILASRHKEIKSKAKRIFQEILFDGCTFEKLEHQNGLLRQLEFFKSQFVQSQIVAQWDDDMEGFSQLCQLTLNTMTDVFIYFSTSMLGSSTVDENESKDLLAENFQMWSFLWLNFIRVLLYYAEEATSLTNSGVCQSSAALNQSVLDNIQRTMEFLVSENILIKQDELESSSGSFAEPSSDLDSEKMQLYRTTCEVLGQYWQQSASQLKVSGIFEKTNS